MANNTHYSSGGGDFRLIIDTHDLTDEVTQALRLALHRALTRLCNPTFLILATQNIKSKYFS